MVLDNPQALWLLPALLCVLACLGLVGWKTRREAAGLLRLDLRRLRARLVEKYLLAALFASCLVAALAMPKVPATAAEVPRRAGEIALLVDVSGSMAAQRDLGSPNRLERAKPIAQEIVDRMEALGDVRISLHGVTSIARTHVPFVGREDYPYLRESIERVLGIYSVPGGGTSLGRPLLDVVGKFSPGEQARIIVLLSDGEVFIGKTRGINRVERGWIEQAVAEATTQGVRVIAVGIGETEGARIPYTDRGGYTGDYAQEGGVDFVSHLEEQGLREIAERTGGQYFPQSDRAGLIACIEAGLRAAPAGGEVRQITAYRSIAPWCALAALPFWVVLARRHLLR